MTTANQNQGDEMGGQQVDVRRKILGSTRIPEAGKTDGGKAAPSNQNPGSKIRRISSADSKVVVSKSAAMIRAASTADRMEA